jgi:thioredoxin 1
MATIELTSDNFNDIVTGSGTIMIDFWAEWCGPCRMFAPVFEKASERYQDIVFGKVDTEEQIELAQAFDIASIPTLMVIRDGVVLYAEAGALPAPMLEELIGKVQDIDMDQVRADIEQHEHDHEHDHDHDHDHGHGHGQAQ